MTAARQQEEDNRAMHNVTYDPSEYLLLLKLKNVLHRFLFCLECLLCFFEGLTVIHNVLLSLQPLVYSATEAHPLNTLHIIHELPGPSFLQLL